MLRKELDKRFPASAKLDAATGALVGKLRVKPATGTFDAIARKLARSEGALEDADAAPTDSQLSAISDTIATLDSAKNDWEASKRGPLAELNAALARAGQKPVEISAAALRDVEEPDAGEDLP